MSEYSAVWALARQRFVDVVLDLNQDQLNWRLHPDSLTIGEMALHVAGVEVSFISQLLGSTLDASTEKLRSASTKGVIDDDAFPYSAGEITPESVAAALGFAKGFTAEHIELAQADLRAQQIKSALGPIIDGDGAFARLAMHPAYHQGQAHLIRTAPGFPKG